MTQARVSRAFFMPNQISDSQVTVEDKNREEQVANARLEASGDETVAWKYNPDYHDIADFLGLQQEDKMNEDVANKISQLRDYVKVKDSTEAKIKLLELQKQLGLQTRGKLLVNALYQYVRLLGDRNKIDKEIGLIKEQYGQ